MSESVVFHNWNRGNRISGFAGVKMREGQPLRHSRDYTYIEIPLGEIYSPTSEEVLTKVAANQKVRIIPACSVKPAPYMKILVKTNPVLQQYSNCPAMFLIDASGEDEVPAFYASFHKGMDAAELSDWCVRLYLVG